AESFGTACVTIHDHLRRLDRTVRLKNSLQVTVTNAVGQIAYVQLLAHGGPPEKNRQGAPHTTAGRRRLAKYTRLPLHGTGERQKDGASIVTTTAGPRDPSTQGFYPTRNIMNRAPSQFPPTFIFPRLKPRSV